MSAVDVGRQSTDMLIMIHCKRCSVLCCYSAATERCIATHLYTSSAIYDTKSNEHFQDLTLDVGGRPATNFICLHAIKS